jgi:hypothetical protein
VAADSGLLAALQQQGKGERAAALARRQRVQAAAASAAASAEVQRQLEEAASGSGGGAGALLPALPGPFDTAPEAASILAAALAAPPPLPPPAQSGFAPPPALLLPGEGGAAAGRATPRPDAPREVAIICGSLLGTFDCGRAVVVLESGQVVSPTGGRLAARHVQLLAASGGEGGSRVG